MLVFTADGVDILRQFRSSTPDAYCTTEPQRRRSVRKELLYSLHTWQIQYMATPEAQAVRRGEVWPRHIVVEPGIGCEHDR